MYTYSLKITRNETWRPKITVPEQDRKAYACQLESQIILNGYSHASGPPAVNISVSRSLREPISRSVSI